ncbi:MAG: BRCT domain-containing protein [Leuconostoc mesenteroides]
MQKGRVTSGSNGNILIAVSCLNNYFYEDQIKQNDCEVIQMIRSQTIVFTGKLLHFNREQAHDLVRALGGYPKPYISKTTTILVVGIFPTDLFKETVDTEKLKKAKQWCNSGTPIKIISEREFIDRVKTQLAAY